MGCHSEGGTTEESTCRVSSLTQRNNALSHLVESPPNIPLTRLIQTTTMHTSNLNSTSTNNASLVTAAHREQFERDGYFILEDVVPAQHLEILRSEVASAMARIDEQMEAKGVERLGLNSKNSRYFVSVLRDEPNNPVAEFVFSPLMADVCRATLGDNAFLFFEQYVVKAAERGESFSWHQDSGYVGYAHRPYLTCWVTLDDVNEENGTVSILPYDRAGTRDWTPHTNHDSNNDLVGYHGDDPGIPVIAPAGSIAVFSSTVFHRSGANNTDKMRRIYLPQYSAEPILKPDGSGLWSMAVPFVVDGEQVNFGA